MKGNREKSEDRFMNLIMPIPESGCWLWMGAIDNKGYGRFKEKVKGKWRMVKAHTWSYLKYNGPISEGLELDHLCRVPCCVNPKHLEAVTHKENMYRGDTLARMNIEKTHCIHGHEFTDTNTYRTIEKGHRVCRTCKKEKAILRRLRIAS